jgi:FtsZ-binding cell division protein ZapB
MDIETGITKKRVPLTDPEDDDKILGEVEEWTPVEKSVTIFASAAVVSSIISLVITFNPVSKFAAILGILIPPYCVYQERKITDIKALKETNQRLEYEVSQLSSSNETLNLQNNQIEASLKRLKESQDALLYLKSSKKASIQDLEKQVEQSEATLALMKMNQINELVDNIFDVMLAVDTDGDFKLSDKEISMLTSRLEGIHDIQIDGSLFKRKIIEAGRDMNAVLSLISDLLNGNNGSVPDGWERVFKFL